MRFYSLIEDTNQAKPIKYNWFSNSNKTWGNQVVTVHGSGTNTGLSSYSWIPLHCFWMPQLHCKTKCLFSAFPFVHLSEYSKICITADMSWLLMYKHKENRFFSFYSFSSVRFPHQKISSCVTLSFCFPLFAAITVVPGNYPPIIHVLPYVVTLQ